MACDANSDAELLALELSNALLPPPSLAKRICRDLETIRQAYPAMATIHHRGQWLPGQLIVGLNRQALIQLQKGKHRDLNLMLAKYGPAEIKILFIGPDNTYFVSIKVKKPVNSNHMAAIIRKASGVISASPNHLAGDGNEIKVSQLGYTFSLGWGDCLCGCTERHEWTYSIVNGQVTLVEETGHPLIANLEAVNTGPVTVGNPVRLKACVGSRSFQVDDYLWTFGDGISGTGNVADHIYPAPGVYTAVVTATSLDSIAKATTTVVVIPNLKREPG